MADAAIGTSGEHAFYPGPAARLAAWSVRQYQRHISPYKRFVCAHRVLHRGESCSEYVLRIVRHAGVVHAIASTRTRFAECRAAARTLQARRFEERLHEEQEEKQRRLNNTSGKPPEWVERCGCVGDALPFAVCGEVACCMDW